MGKAGKRWLKYFVFLTVPSLVAALLTLELVFAIVIPATTTPNIYFEPKDQILRFGVNGPRTGTYTIGNLAQGRAKWRVNNMGWNSDIDYVSAERGKPLIAIYGDPYVQASITARLRQT